VAYLERSNSPGVIVLQIQYYDELYSPLRQYGQYSDTQTDKQTDLTDRYKYNKTDTMKTKLKEKIKTRI